MTKNVAHYRSEKPGDGLDDGQVAKFYCDQIVINLRANLVSEFVITFVVHDLESVRGHAYDDGTNA